MTSTAILDAFHDLLNLERKNLTKLEQIKLNDAQCTKFEGPIVHNNKCETCSQG